MWLTDYYTLFFSPTGPPVRLPFIVLRRLILPLRERDTKSCIYNIVEGDWKDGIKESFKELILEKKKEKNPLFFAKLVNIVYGIFTTISIFSLLQSPLTSKKTLIASLHQYKSNSTTVKKTPQCNEKNYRYNCLKWTNITFTTSLTLQLLKRHHNVMSQTTDLTL